MLITYALQSSSCGCSGWAATEADDRALHLGRCSPRCSPLFGVLGRGKAGAAGSDEQDMKDVPTLAISLKPKRPCRRPAQGAGAVPGTLIHNQL